MQEKMSSANKIDKVCKGRYTEEERKNKYRFQARWQRKNKYIQKSYRLNDGTVKRLLEFSKENNVSQVSVLRNAYKRFIEQNPSDCSFNYEMVVNNKRIDVKKCFKAKEEFTKEIENTCKEHNYSYGYFVTMILDDYMDVA